MGNSTAKLEFSNTLKDLYQLILKIRTTELTLTEEYKKQEMRTPAHFGVGQEAIAAGVCYALTKNDAVYSHHRCHNHYLAMGGDVFKLASELYGRKTGCSGGYGGSVHLTDRDSGFIGSSAILGETIALAVGSALAFKMNNEKRVAVTFFGEATCEEGVVYESMNYASINKLPVIFVCENNLYSTESPLKIRQPEGTDLCKRAEAFMIKVKKVDGNDVMSVYKTAVKAYQHCLEGNGPFFMECMTYRWLEHVGPNYDHESNRTYRTKEELDEWKEKCPVKQAEKIIINKQILTKEELVQLKENIDTEVKLAVKNAYESEWPEVDTLFNNI